MSIDVLGRGLLLSALGAFFFTGCVGDGDTAVEAAAPATAVDPASHTAVSSRGDELASREAASRELVKDLAMALRDPVLRVALHQALTSSPVSEQKLHLRTHLQGAGAPLLAAAREEARASQGADVLTLLERAGSLEVYLPVAAHRQAWKGSEDLIVGTQLDDMKGEMFGYSLSGKDVALSRKGPPLLPVLMVVPSESFSEDGLALHRALAGKVDLGTQAILYTGLWANSVTVANAGDYEGWGMGNPEFELQVQQIDPISNTRTRISCSQEDGQTGGDRWWREPFLFNMDGGSYSLPFMILDDEQIEMSEAYVMVMYEDDDTRCVVRVPNDQIKYINDRLASTNSSYRSIIHPEPTGAVTASSYPVQAVVYQIMHWLGIPGIPPISGGDDLVGVVAGLSNVSTTPANFYFKKEDLSIAGTIVLQRKADRIY